MGTEGAFEEAQFQPARNWRAPMERISLGKRGIWEHLFPLLTLSVPGISSQFCTRERSEGLSAMVQSWQLQMRGNTEEARPEGIQKGCWQRCFRTKKTNMLCP